LPFSLPYRAAAGTSTIRGTQWAVLDATGKLCTSLFMTPDGRVGTRWELGLRYFSETVWTGNAWLIADTKSSRSLPVVRTSSGSGIIQTTFLTVLSACAERPIDA
jgi:hypothetical protein